MMTHLLHSVRTHNCPAWTAVRKVLIAQNPLFRVRGPPKLLEVHICHLQHDNTNHYLTHPNLGQIRPAKPLLWCRQLRQNLVHIQATWISIHRMKNETVHVPLYVYLYLWGFYTSCEIKYIKVKQSHYRPGQALRVPEGWGSQISRQSAHEGGKVVSPTHRPPLPPREYFWYSFLLESESTPGAIVRPEGLCQWKIPMTPSGMETATFRLVRKN